MDGRNPFRTTLKPLETTVCWYLQGNHHSIVSEVVQDFVLSTVVPAFSGMALELLGAPIEDLFGIIRPERLHRG